MRRTVQGLALGTEEALNDHLSNPAECGDAIPVPSNIDAVEADEGPDKVRRLLVRGDRPGKAVRMRLSINEGLLDRVVENRSRFLADAARAALAGQSAT